MTIAEFAHVTRRYGDLVAVDDVSLGIDPGVIVGLLGPNGAGKTTLMSLLQGLRRPTSGRVTLFGGRPGRRAGAPAARIDTAGDGAARHTACRRGDRLRRWPLRRSGADGRAGRGVRTRRGAATAVRIALGRSEETCRRRARLRRPPAAGPPRRADDGPRRGCPPHPVGGHPSPARGGCDGRRHEPLLGRDRGARSARRGARRRARARRRHRRARDLARGRQPRRTVVVQQRRDRRASERRAARERGRARDVHRDRRRCVRAGARGVGCRLPRPRRAGRNARGSLPRAHRGIRDRASSRRRPPSGRTSHDQHAHRRAGDPSTGRGEARRRRCASRRCTRSTSSSRRSACRSP